MELTLKIDEQDKTFVSPFISGRMLRKTIEITKNNNLNDMDEAKLDSMIDYVAEAYGGQFTRDEFYDGIESSKLLPTIMATINGIAGRTAVAVNDPNVQ